MWKASPIVRVLPSSGTKPLAKSSLVGQRPQRRAVAVHDDLLALPHPLDTVQPPSNGTTVGRRCATAARSSPGSPPPGRRVTSRSSQAILSREYCQNGLRSGVDSVTGSRAGGVW